MLQYLDQVSEVGGERAVPFMQVLLMLTSDMDSEEDRDRAVLDAFLTAVIKQLELTGTDLESIGTRSKKFEVKLIMLRLMSVLLSKTRGGMKTTGEVECFYSFLSESLSLNLFSLSLSLSQGLL